MSKQRVPGKQKAQREEKWPKKLVPTCGFSKFFARMCQKSKQFQYTPKSVTSVAEVNIGFKFDVQTMNNLTMNKTIQYLSDDKRNTALASSQPDVIESVYMQNSQQ